MRIKTQPNESSILAGQTKDGQRRLYEHHVDEVPDPLKPNLGGAGCGFGLLHKLSPAQTVKARSASAVVHFRPSDVI
ncbi:hypothetical protein AOLI_G00042690 [Acnodon oligacanthus]